MDNNTLRPCVVIQHSRRSRGGIPEELKHAALFHAWTIEQEPIGAGLTVGSHPAGQLSRARALVEFQDGRVRLVSPELLYFLDTEEKMAPFIQAYIAEEQEHDDV